MFNKKIIFNTDNHSKNDKESDSQSKFLLCLKFEDAAQNRRTEIEAFWLRNGFMSVIVFTIFLAYAQFSTANNQNSFLLLSIVIMGFIISIIWILMTCMGEYHHQNNATIYYSLYKEIFDKDEPSMKAPVSVTSLAVCLSFIVTVCWFLLLLYSAINFGKTE